MELTLFGYRNIYYDNRKSQVTLWTWDQQGNRIDQKYSFKPYLFIESSNPPFDGTSIYNTNLRKLVFNSQFDRRKYVKESGMRRIFYNIPPEQQFLIEFYGQQNKNPNFSKHPLRIFYMDIETDSPNEFPQPEEAKDPIFLITIYDTLDDRWHTWGLKNDYTPTTSNSFYYKCNTEEELLKEFLKYWRHNYPDLITGWNSGGFDLPYIINRIKRILGDDQANHLSPVDVLYKKENVMKNIGGGVMSKWYIKGMTHLDYLDLYLTFSKDKRESYSLNNISEIELDEGKLSYNATSLTQLASTDWNKFVEYNLKDVELIIRLEEKLSFISIARMLSYLGLGPIEWSMGTISIVTGAIALKALEQNKYIATFESTDKKRYAGGFVKEPDPGLCESIVTFDVNSLYPNTIISLNISPETKLGNLLSLENDIAKFRLITGKEYELDKSKFVKFLKDDSVSISASKVLFTQKEKGVFPLLIDGIYKDRVEFNRKIKAYKKEIQKHKPDTEIYSKTKEKMDKLNIIQHVLKILLNRCYGTFANEYSPFYDIDCASSITLTGQKIIKHTSDYIDEYLKNKYGIIENSVKYNDTDSLFITIAPVLKKLNIPLIENNIVTEEAHKIALDVKKKINQDIKEWAKNTLNSIDPRYEFKKEAICDTAIFLIKKKRYILHILDEGDDEPYPCDRTKFVGVQIASTKTPKAVKPFLKRIVDRIIKTRSKSKTDEEYYNIYDEFRNNISLESLAMATGINNLNKYQKNANGFNTGKGTPSHVKAAIYYNLLLDKYGVTGKYEKIHSGMKIKVFYALKNKFGIQNIGFIDKYPTEFEIQIDKEKMFDILITQEVKRYYDAIGWNLIEPSSRKTVDLNELFS